MVSHGVLASSMVDQFTKGQLSFDFWVFSELVLALNQKKSARKRMQEIVEISWKFRKSELVKLKYKPNDYKWGTFGCPTSYYYIILFPSDDSWTLWYVSCASWDISWPNWMFSWAIKYQYFHQIWPRKPSNLARKCLRMRRKRIIESRSHHWNISQWNSSS